MSWDIGVTKNRHPDWWNIRAECSECGAAIYLVRNKREYPTQTDMENGIPNARILQDHADQHKPGRALDIDVEYELVAYCSVCEDGGEVEQDSSDVLVCQECGTTWNVDGTMGERNE